MIEQHRMEAWEMGDRIRRLEEQLAASQARERRLREGLVEIADSPDGWDFTMAAAIAIANAALADAGEELTPAGREIAGALRELSDSICRPRHYTPDELGRDLGQIERQIEAERAAPPG